MILVPAGSERVDNLHLTGATLILVEFDSISIETIGFTLSTNISEFASPNLAHSLDWCSTTTFCGPSGRLSS